VPKFISIDLEPQGIFAVAGTAQRSQTKIDQAVAWAGGETEGGPPTLTLDTAQRIGEQLRERLRAAGVAHAPVVVTIGRDRIVLKEVRYPAVPPQEEPNVVRFQAIKELSDSPDDVVLDYVPLSNGAPEGERRSMAVAVRKDLYSAIRAMCSAANVKLEAVTPRPYALAAGLRRAFASGSATPPESTTEAVAILTLGPGGGEFNVVRDGEVLFMVAVPAPVVASEPMLIAQVRRNLATYSGSNPAHPVQALYIADASDDWPAKFRTLGIPVHSYDPLAGAMPTVPETMRGRFAGAVGLLTAQSTTLPINFVSPRQPKADANPKRNQFLIAALVAILLLGGLGIGGYFMLDAADKDIDKLTKDRDDKKKQVEAFEPDLNRLDATNKWKTRRVNWLDELFDMADRFPSAAGFYASSFIGKALVPDAKTGKQENQGSFSIKVSSHSPDPVTALMTTISNDGNKKYYVGVDKTTGGPTQGDKDARDYLVFGKINARPAADYVRAPSFVPPSRKVYPPLPASVKEAKDAADKEHDIAEAAPPPKEKPEVPVPDGDG
jgi:hypothetical protein